MTTPNGVGSYRIRGLSSAPATREEPCPEYGPAPRTRAQELLVFALLAVLIWPIAAVGVVSAYGLGVWTYQQIMGPPGPPRH